MLNKFTHFKNILNTYFITFITSVKCTIWVTVQGAACVYLHSSATSVFSHVTAAARAPWDYCSVHLVWITTQGDYPTGLETWKLWFWALGWPSNLSRVYVTSCPVSAVIGKAPVSCNPAKVVNDRWFTGWLSSSSVLIIWWVRYSQMFHLIVICNSSNTKWQ